MIPTYLEINQPDLHLLVCHDPFNRRMRVDELRGDLQVGQAMIRDQAPDWAEKIILKARREQVDSFLQHGWVQEAEIPGDFGGEDMFFLVYYRQTRRSRSDQTGMERSITQKILTMGRNPGNPTEEKIQRSTMQDAEKLATLYKAVFAVYPTPLGDVSYIQKTMENGTVYVHIEKEGRVLSAASAEVNRKFSNAEMTDCATLPTEEGKGHMAALLARLEEILLPEGIQCLYTICRAQSFGMNKVFYNLGYEYSGCLVNNCHIYSGLENMNVWYKLRS